MDRLGSTHTTNVGTRNDKKHSQYISILQLLKAEALVAIEAWAIVLIVFIAWKVL